MLYSHIIFDMDGTLLDTLEDLGNACNHICEQRGWPTFSLDRYRYKVGNGMPKLVERIVPAEFAGNGSVFRSAYDDFCTYYAAHKEDATRPYEGIAPTLEALHRAGVKLAVLTNKDHAAAVPLTKRYFGEGLFDVVQGRIDSLPAKPAAPLTRHVMEQLGAKADTCLYVGDSNVDVETGHNAGLKVAGAVWGFRGADELREAGADYLMETPHDLLDIAL